MRQFVLDRNPGPEGDVTLTDRDFRYLAQVLRLAPGDTVEARLTDGTLCTLRIAAVDKKAKTVRLTCEKSQSITSSASSAGCSVPQSDRLCTAGQPGVSMPPLPAMQEGFPQIILFQWLLKGPKMDQVIRQATETGVSFIVPVMGERCLTRDAEAVGSGKTDRWDRIVREARQQSGSPVATVVLSPVAVSGLSRLWHEISGGKKAEALVLTEAPLARKSLHEYLVTGIELAALAIGPEGGMTARELEQLADIGFDYVHFRTNILRSETAALYGIAAVQSALTESEKWQLKESNF